MAQGYYVYHLTEDESKLALVSFASSFPVFLFGFMAGSLADAFDRRVVLIATQALLGAAALYLAIATWTSWSSCKTMASRKRATSY